ncbi:MAG TPA: ABC transporter ATP-binding protein [Candidatus Poseidoniales archaeon]|nr:ABC transporter ATP-binding protein [Candidatus Poseidoniales archaeon]
MNALEIKGLVKHFGGIKAVEKVDFTVGEGEFVGLIGPNGCGKSTTFNTISGLLEATAGEVYVFGKDASGKAPHVIHNMGLTRTFQHTRLWKDMTVIENLLVPPRKQKGQYSYNALSAVLFDKEEEKARVAKAWKILETLEITHTAHLLAGELSGGQSKLVDIGRSLMGDPKLLLLDEPVAGVAGPLADSIFSHLRNLVSTTGISILIIEHNMDFILRKGVDKVIVMNSGKVLMSGTPEEVRANEDVVKAYLGGADIDIDEEIPAISLVKKSKSQKNQTQVSRKQSMVGCMMMLMSFFVSNYGSVSNYDIVSQNSHFTSLIGEHLLEFGLADFIFIGYLISLIIFSLSQVIIILSLCYSIVVNRSIIDDATHIIAASGLIFTLSIVMTIFSSVIEIGLAWGALLSTIAGVVLFLPLPITGKKTEEEE